MALDRRRQPAQGCCNERRADRRGIDGPRSQVSQPVWSPSPERVEGSLLRAFWRRAEAETGRNFESYQALQHWSVESMEQFWRLVWDFCEVLGDSGDGPVLVAGDQLPGARFFPAASLSFAENLLLRQDSAEALVFWSEPGERRAISHLELGRRVGSLAAALREMGVQRGDRVAAFLPNLPETVVAFLATASIGAIWSSCSPDFGVRRRARSLRTDRAEGPVRRRRVLLQRQDPRPARTRGSAARGASQRRARGRGALRRHDRSSRPACRVAAL